MYLKKFFLPLSQNPFPFPAIIFHLMTLILFFEITQKKMNKSALIMMYVYLCIWFRIKVYVDFKNWNGQ